MVNELVEVVERFPARRVVVVGDALLDSYLSGTADRLCREAPVPVVRLHERTDCPGGAANTALNVAALGAAVELVSVVGDDDEGRVLARLLEEAGVDARGVVIAPGRRTLCLQRVTASGQLLARVDQGSSEPIGPDVATRVVERLRAVVADADAVIVSDYGHGALGATVVAALAELQARHPRVLVVDSKHPAAFRSLRPTAVKPNWSEALALLGSGELDGVDERAAGIASHGAAILEVTGADIVAVTLDSEGALVFERGRPPHRTYARPRPDANSAGAGDTFVAALSLALVAGASTPAAAEIASAAAAVAVSRTCTIPCTIDELRVELLGADKMVPDPDRLVATVARHRAAGRSIVFTNGCFDLLHRGHITYLNRAKTLGDVLVVGINTDDSVRELKGADRPINPLEDRVQVLSALSCVDHVVPFAERSPGALLEAARPDLYVKGGDYSRDTLPEAPVVERLGIEVVFLPLMQDRSTSSIIERIRKDVAATR